MRNFRTAFRPTASPAGRAFAQLALAVAAGALPAAASAVTIVNAALQVSNSGAFNAFGASLSADGSRMAFYSAGNQTGGNGDNNFEIYTYDRGSNAVTRVTDLAGGIAVGGHQSPKISGDGSRIVYQQFVVDGGFVDFQTFTRNLNTAVTTAVTPRNDFFEQAAISHDGSRIVVQTDNTGMRLFNTATNGLSGVVVAGNGSTFSISGDGTRIARAGFNGSSSVIDLSTNTTTAVTPNGAGFNLRPDISANGRYVAYTANYNPLGSNADGSGEVFLFDTQTSLVRQLTQAAGGVFDSASISADGSRVAFSSTANLLGSNADGNQEIFVYDVFEDSLLQVTNTQGNNFFSVESELSADGRWLAFSSSANFTGGNADRGSEVFLVGLSAQRVNGVPTPSSAWLVLAALLGGGLVSSHRRSA